MLAAHDADHAVAEQQLRDAIERFDQIEHFYWRAVTEVDLAELLLTQARAEDAALLLDRAVSLLAPLEAMPVLSRARALMQPMAMEQA